MLLGASSSSSSYYPGFHRRAVVPSCTAVADDPRWSTVSAARPSSRHGKLSTMILADDDASLSLPVVSTNVLMPLRCRSVPREGGRFSESAGRGRLSRCPGKLLLASKCPLLTTMTSTQIVSMINDHYNSSTRRIDSRTVERTVQRSGILIIAAVGSKP